MASLFVVFVAICFSCAICGAQGQSSTTPRPYQPLLWNRNLNYGVGQTLSSPLLMGPGNTSLVLSNNEEILTFDTTTFRLVGNESSIPVINWCPPSDIGCAITTFKALSSMPTRVIWSGGNYFGIFDLGVGVTFADNFTDPLSSSSLSQRANVFFAAYSHSGQGYLCAYNVSGSAKKMWCSSFCTSTGCIVQIGDVDAVSGLVFLVTDDENVIAASLANGSIIWKTPLAGSVRSNGPLLLQNRSLVTFTDGQAINFYRVSDGAIVNNLPNSQGDKIQLFLMPNNSMLIFDFNNNVSTIDLHSLDSLSYNETLSQQGSTVTTAGDTVYVSNTMGGNVMTLALKAIDLDHVLWESEAFGAPIAYPQMGWLMFSYNDAAYLVNASNGDILIKIAINGGQESVNYPAYSAASDSWFFTTNDGYVAQAQGVNAASFLISNGYSYGSASLSASGKSLFVTPGNWQVGLLAINVANWSITQNVVIPQSTINFAKTVTEGLNCGPSGVDMLYLPIANQSRTVIAAFRRSDLSLEWMFGDFGSNELIYLFISSDCMIYTGTDNNTVLKISAVTGRLVWSNLLAALDEFPGPGFSYPPVVGTVSSIFYLSDDSSVRAVDPSTGTQQWATKLLAPNGSPYQPQAPPVYYQGAIYISHTNCGRFYVLSQVDGSFIHVENIPAAWAPVPCGPVVYFAVNGAISCGIAWYDTHLKTVGFMYLSEDSFDVQGPTIADNGLLMMIHTVLFVMHMPSRTLLWKYAINGSTAASFGPNGYIYAMENGVTIFNQFTGEIVLEIPHSTGKVNEQVFPLVESSQRATLLILQDNELFKYEHLWLPTLIVPTFAPSLAPITGSGSSSGQFSTPQPNGPNWTPQPNGPNWTPQPNGPPGPPSPPDENPPTGAGLTSGAWAIPFFLMAIVALGFVGYFFYHRKRYVPSGGDAVPSEMIQHLEEFNSPKAV